MLKLAQNLPPLPDIYKIPENRVPGCISLVYVYGIDLEGKINFWGDSDAQLTKGLLGLLITGLSGLSPEEIILIKPDFIQEIGLNIRLTPSRSNGFYNIFQMMQKKALIYLRDDQE